MNDVMIIDDNEFYATYIEKVLKRENIKSVKYLNPVIALDDILEKNVKPSVIFLDIMMPVINGYEFLEKFLEDNALRETPIIVCSALEVPEDIVEKYKMLKILFLQKPISSESVLESYNSMLN